MKINRFSSILIRCLAAVGSLVLCSSWGFRMHRDINRESALAQDSTNLRWFKLHAEELAKRSTLPDERKGSIPGEARKHFIDLDLYDSTEWRTIPRKWDEAVARYGLDTVNRRGTVPWAIMSCYDKLVSAMSSPSLNEDSILHYAADLGHYIADAHVPFHTTANYDGQFTNQKGIHSLYESQTPRFWGDTLQYKLSLPKDKMTRSDLVDSIWEGIYRANALLEFSLEAERRAKASLPEKLHYTMIANTRGNRQVPSDTLVKTYHRMLDRTVELQARRSSQLLAQFWHTAWVEAGQPELGRKGKR